MSWEHWEIGQEGNVVAFVAEKPVRCPYAIGSITTGRQRVFHRHFVAISLPDGSRIEGRDPHCIVAALEKVGAFAAQYGFRLFAAGLDPRFYESGLSFNSSWGYMEGHDRAIHMMDAPPYPRVAVEQEM